MSSHSSGKGHHHHHHGIWYRMRRWMRHNKKFAAAAALLCIVVLSAGGFFLLHSQKEQSRLHVTAGNSVDMKGGYRTITWKDKDYQYNSLITTILYAGLDSTDPLKASETYSNKARADSVSVVILDKKKKKMSILALNRDTMTEIRRYTRTGEDMGTYVSHLGYAYSYGDGGEVSCEDLKEAVEKLLGISIDEYAVTNQSSITSINDLVGGVTVTVPNDDLAAMYPELKKGAVVTLDDSNVKDFLQHRDTAADFSNEGRIERQQAYVTAYVDLLKDRLASEPDQLWQEIGQMNDYLQTSITKNKYLSLARLLEKVSFTDADYYRPTGKDSAGELHDEFYVDEDALQQLVIDLFYEEV
ncbi:MAG: LCP family protein [Lachnospiraceae bacterium]|nr:LCP family protein [Lachnospiraceae bacterium]